jgi:hypothetical protein
MLLLLLLLWVVVVVVDGVVAQAVAAVWLRRLQCYCHVEGKEAL